MSHPSNDSKKQLLSLRHSQEVVKFVVEEADKNNELKSAFCRKVFNAGLEALYPIKIKANKIVSLPPAK